MRLKWNNIERKREKITEELTKIERENKVWTKRENEHSEQENRKRVREVSSE